VRQGFEEVSGYGFGWVGLGEIGVVVGDGEVEGGFLGGGVGGKGGGEEEARFWMMVVSLVRNILFLLWTFD
jgi:hypothetical protein